MAAAGGASQSGGEFHEGHMATPDGNGGLGETWDPSHSAHASSIIKSHWDELSKCSLLTHVFPSYVISVTGVWLLSSLAKITTNIS